MFSSEKPVNVLIYLNELGTCESIKKVVKNYLPYAEVSIVTDFDNFYKHISQNPVDCFFISLHIENVNAENIVEKLRKSRKFNKSVIAFCAGHEHGIAKEQFSSIGINFVINDRTTPEDFQKILFHSLTKYYQKTIPENHKVLAVDDSPEILDVICGHLTEMGHQRVKKSNDVKSTIELLNNDEFDLILLDWNLPDGSCIDLIEHIRKTAVSERTKNAIIIVITGRSEVDDIMTLLKYNVVDYIIKPFEFSEFDEKIAYAYERCKKAK